MFSLMVLTIEPLADLPEGGGGVGCCLDAKALAISGHQCESH